MEVQLGSRTFVASASSSEKLGSPFVNSSTCQANIRSRSSPSFFGFPCSPKRFSSLQRRREGRGGNRAPSALLNAHEYRKQKLEKVLLKEMGSDIENGDNDEDLCPIECVREINKLSELDHALEDSKTSGALVVVDFFRTSCGSCRYIEKGFQKLCKGAGNGETSVIFLKHNVMDEYDEQSDIAEKFRVKVVPLFHFYKNGELVESFPTRDKAKIREAIYKHLDVNQTIEEWTDLHGLK